MMTAPFDTLKFSDRLEAGGFTSEQARTATAAMSEVLADADLVTGNDVDHLATKADLSELKADLLKWALPILLGQSALTAALVKML